METSGEQPAKATEKTELKKPSKNGQLKRKL